VTAFSIISPGIQLIEPVGPNDGTQSFDFCGFGSSATVNARRVRSWPQKLIVLRLHPTQRRVSSGWSRVRSCNQLRQKIGVIYGNPETTTGGNALKFYCSVRLDIRRKKAIKRGEESIGSEVKVKVVKNKLAPPFREADFEILYGTGVNKLGELVDTAEKLGVVEKSGTWYSYEGNKIGQGRDKMLAHLDERPALQQQLRDILIQQSKRAATAGAAGVPGANGHAATA